MRKLVKTLLQLPSEFRVVPCRGKIPLKRGWNDPQCNYTPRCLVDTIIKYRGRFLVQSKTDKLYVQTLTGIGVVCGEYPQGYLVAIDCDSNEAIELLNSLQLPVSASYTSGRKNRLQTLYWLDRPIPNFNLKLGLEVRGKNKLTILPPSLHPQTKAEYYWLEHISKGIARIDSRKILAFKPKRHHKPTYSQTGCFHTAMELLNRIDYRFGADYHNWIAIGMALHSVDTSLLDIWDEWSSRCDKYVEGECELKWRSFNRNNNRNGGYTIGTLYYFANLSRSI